MSSRSRDRTGAFAAASTLAAAATLLGVLYYFDLPNLLQQRVKTRKLEPRCYLKGSKPSLEAFKILTQQITLKKTYPRASEIQRNIPIYDCNSLNLQDVEALQDELYHILTAGPGVFVMKHFCPDLVTIEAANRAYDNIIQREMHEVGAKGDHFAPASANSRIWNSFSKHALEDPESFARYFSNPWFQIVCESYLGPAYRLTSQVNIVRPGGKAQMPHRDYHLGFQTDEDVVRWPKAVHTMSSLLTLQGAVAHTDMPVESGPTRLLPFSQMFEEGFRSYRSQPFVDYFLENFVSLPLEQGDAIFFNPALFHAAGENCTEDFSRSANLIQVSSAFGKPMETIDTLPIIGKTYDLLSTKFKEEGMSAEIEALICAIAEGYPFPTNLDCRPPASNGMAPESEQDILKRGLSEGWHRQRMLNELADMRLAGSAEGSQAVEERHSWVYTEGKSNGSV